MKKRNPLLKQKYNTERVKKVKHGGNMKDERNSYVLKECNLTKVQHEGNMKCERNSETCKECNMHKRITDRPLTDRDTLVLIYAVKQFVRWHITAGLLRFTKYFLRPF